jgi:hypothetical protein
MKVHFMPVEQVDALGSHALDKFQAVLYLRRYSPGHTPQWCCD